MQPEYSTDHDEQQPAPSEPGGRPPAPGLPLPGPRPPRIPLRLPQTPPTFTYLLLGVIVLVYLAGQVIPVDRVQIIKGIPVRSGEELLLVYGAKINPFILQDGEYYRLLTMIFLHGGLAHLFFNGYALYEIGTDIERLFGHARFLIIYFLGGLTASLASLILSDGWSVGASGALFAIFGAEMVFLYRNRRVFGEFARRRLNSLIYLLVLNLLIGVVGSGLIDNWAHIGGFLGGVGLAWLIAPQFRPEPPTPDNPLIELVDENPLQERIIVPFLWSGGLLLVLGLLVLGQR